MRGYQTCAIILPTQWVCKTDGVSAVDGYFEIHGNPIKLSEIKDFRIVQREYIYRPSYKEKENAFLRAFSNKKYDFYMMIPYAAILDEREWKSAMSSYKAKGFKDSLGKDLIEGAVGMIGDKLNIKTFKSKKFKCMNTAGRIFMTYLEDIPALVYRNDGKISDVYKNDEIYPDLGEPIAPAINEVHALKIKADEEYIFYGNGIQVEDIKYEYERLKHELSLAGVAQVKEKANRGLPKFKIPQLQIPKLKGPAVDDTEDLLKKLKDQFKNGKLSEEDYLTRIKEIMKDL